jgi:hypothetical protein
MFKKVIGKIIKYTLLAIMFLIIWIMGSVACTVQNWEKPCPFDASQNQPTPCDR